MDGRSENERLESAPAPDRLASLERQHQELVIDREMRLQESYAAIRKSRKLLNALDALKPLYGAFNGPQLGGNSESHRSEKPE
jgi:hypothetical protein